MNAAAKEKSMNGPTLNAKFNEFHARSTSMGGIGTGHGPQCMGCLVSLRGKNVVDTGDEWVCEACAEAMVADADTQQG